MTRGRLQLEWHHGPRSLEVEFELPDRLHYLKWDPALKVEDECIVPADVGQLQLLLDWF